MGEPGEPYDPNQAVREMTKEEVQQGRLQQLADESGALWDSAAGCWVMPFYNTATDVDFMPIGEWKRKRQEAAEELLATRTTVPRLPCGCLDICQGHAEPDPEAAFRDQEEGVDTSPPSDGKIHTIADIEQVIDNWQHRSDMMKCRTCMWYVRKNRVTPGKEIGRCRHSAPTIKGWPAIYPDDWCGAHKLDEEKT